jgi:hypothetical protein
MRADMSSWQRLTVITVVIAFLFAQLPALVPGAGAQQTQVTLREGREIMARMLDDARSRNVAAGDRVRFEVTEDVEVHGHIAVKQGTIGTLQISEVKRNGMLWGKPGHVVFGEGSIPSYNMEIPVLLSGRNVFPGRSKKLTAILLTPLLVGLFLRGGQGGLEAGEPIILAVPKTLQAPALEDR